MPWRVDFSHPNLLPEEQPNITTQVTTAHNNVQALRQARNATVYSAGGTRWWHSNQRDRRTHVTVRYLGAGRPTRAHVYTDGTASIRPARATRALVSEDGIGSATASLTARDDAEEDEGAYSPFSDEEVETGVEDAGN